MGTGGNGFFDPGNAWFLPFNVEPPTMGDDGFGQGDAWNFGLHTGQQVDMMEAHHRASVGHQGGHHRMEGLDGLDGGG